MVKTIRFLLTFFVKKQKNNKNKFNVKGRKIVIGKIIDPGMLENCN